MKNAVIIAMLLASIVGLWIASRAYGRYAYMKGHADGTKGMATIGWPNRWIYAAMYDRGQEDAMNKKPPTP